MSEDLRRELRANPVLAPLSEAVFERLVVASPVRRYERGERILSDGDEAATVFALLEGAVRVFHESPQGIQVVVKIFRPPAIFGEMECLCGLPYLEYVDVLETARLLCMPRRAFAEAMRADGVAAFAMLRDICARLCIATHNEKSLAFDSATTRLANFLVTFATFQGRPDGDGTAIDLTQDQMADALGVTRRAVATDIIRWQRQGLLARAGRGYRIVDLDGLARESDPLQIGLAYRMGDDLAPVAERIERRARRPRR